MHPNHHTGTQHNIGHISDAMDRTGVDQAFRTLTGSPTTVCITCQQAAVYRLIPKSGHYPTIELEDKGYVCQYHTSQLDPNIWGLRPLSSPSK